MCSPEVITKLRGFEESEKNRAGVLTQRVGPVRSNAAVPLPTLASTIQAVRQGSAEELFYTRDTQFCA